MGNDLGVALLYGTTSRLSGDNPALLHTAAAALLVAALLGGLLIKGPARSVAPAETWAAPTRS
ncbi:hypothetical protein [Streptomyces sp. NPDC096095]|uniref:hypothetical protein n=1 Tax=Streptomyces sp. NPDC096095 TaxID=3155545 RepID=UPI003322EAC1